jgi:hypothetical protein
MSTMPSFFLVADEPLAAEMLEHWAAKLVVRGAPGDAEKAQEAQRAAEEFRAWQREQGARA